MSERGDPIDKVYAQAESLLQDVDAQIARRARVLGALTRDSETRGSVNSSAVRRHAWRRDSWLAAASIAGLGVFLAARVYQAPPQPSPNLPPPPAVSASASSSPDRRVTPSNVAPTESEGAQRAPKLKGPARARLAMAPPPLNIEPVAAPPPAAMAKANAFPAEPESSSPREEIVTAERRIAPLEGGYHAPTPTGGLRDESLSAASAARKPAPPPPPPPPAPLAQLRADSFTGSTAAQAMSLRAASVEGRLSNIAALLAQGVPVDAPDARGETALMKSIQADKPAAASLLLKHGAKLERRNLDGVSAREMAAAASDPALKRAAGLTP